jgi:hypothetical protein
MKNTGKNGPNRAQAVGFAGPCLAPAVFLALVATAAADIHYVNAVGGSPAAPYTNWATAATNIQAAVDEAVNGDVVLVANGLYTPSTDVFVSTGIVVRSANGALNTVVDGSDLVRGFYVVGPGAMAAGFTVINGNANSGEGGGVYCDDNATVKNCIIRGSVAHHGGGIYVGAGAMVTNCILSGNDATQGILPHGGAIHCAGGSAFGCRVYDNYAGFYGGGIYCTGGGVVRNCEAWDNVSSSAGGGMAIQDSGLIENCTVVDNESNWGGGIYVITGGDVRDRRRR